MSDSATPREMGTTRLYLRRFEWERDDQQVTIGFRPGLNIIGARTQAERTMILRLIRYAMGGSAQRLDEEIVQTTRRVRLDFTANGQQVTSEREPEHPFAKFRVAVEGETPQEIAPARMGETMLGLLGLPKVYCAFGERRVLVSFNDVARAFVVDRDFSYTEILAKQSSEQRKVVVRLMLGLTTQEMADIEEEIRNTQGRLQRLEADARAIERLLAKFDVGSLLEIAEQRGQLEAAVADLDSRQAALQAHVRASSSAIPGLTATSAEYASLREELLEKRDRVESIRDQLRQLSRQIQEKTELRVVLDSEVTRLERFASAKFVLSTFTFSHCPRCLREIDQQMRDQEQGGLCMLCTRPLQDEHDQDHEAWAKSVTDARRALSEVDQLLAHYTGKSAVLRDEAGLLQERMQWLSAELNLQTQQYVSPLLEELGLLAAQRTEVAGSLSRLRLAAEQREYADRIQHHDLPTIRGEAQRAERRLEELRAMRGARRNRTDAFIEHFSAFMRSAGAQQFRWADWDDDECLPRVNSQHYTRALTGPDLAIGVLAFHYALLAAKVLPPGHDTWHPGLLILDEPQQQMMSPVQYHAIMQQLVTLMAGGVDQAQVVVAATDVTQFEKHCVDVHITKSD